MLKLQAETTDAAVFDFDFTLADSSAGVIECAGYALREMGFPPAEPGAVRRTIGLSLERGLEDLTGSVDPAQQARYRSLFVARADEVMVDRAAWLPGAVESLDLLRETGLKLGIVSTKYRYRIQAILEKHGALDRFAAIVGIEDIPLPKPDPSGLLLALKTMSTRTSQAIYVGDHVVDAEAAKRAGVRFVGVLTGTTTADEFTAFEPWGILDSVRELPSFLAGKRA